MDHREVRRMWEQNAETWIRLARMGCDVYRDHVNTPAFLAALPAVAGQRGLDIGCGEGHNTRELASRGARMTAFDIARPFIQAARACERESPQGITYCLANAAALPFGSRQFDFATAFMSLMDTAELERVVVEAYRVLCPGGFLQFSISHPCFATRRWRWLQDEDGARTAVACGDYFAADPWIEEWIFGAAPAELKAGLPRFRVPRFPRTLSGWLNLLIDAGFVVERLIEPRADEETVARCPDVADTRVVAFFLIIRARKPHTG